MRQMPFSKGQRAHCVEEVSVKGGSSILIESAYGPALTADWLIYFNTKKKAVSHNFSKGSSISWTAA